MLHRITFLSTALVLALLALPLGVLPQPEAEASQPAESPSGDTAALPDEADPESRSEPGQTVPADEPAAPTDLPQTEAQDAETPSAEPEAPSPADTSLEESSPEAETTQLRVLLPDGTVEDMELEDYLWGVLAAEMPASFQEEALKAQAVAARTYTLYQLSHPKEAHPEADLCTDYTCCQAWISREDRLAQWPEEEQENYAGRISAALEGTQGQLLTWEGEPALTVFHASSAGRTRSAQSVWGRDLPYLVSVESPEGEEDAPNYYSVVTLTGQEFSELFLAAYPEADLSGPVSGWFGASETDDSGAPSAFSVGGITVTAQELRSLCSLRSATFTVECGEEELTFYVTGYGHGVGMSQYGANVLAQQGLTWEEILSHYYPGTALTELSAEEVSE